LAASFFGCPLGLPLLLPVAFFFGPSFNLTGVTTPNADSTTATAPPLWSISTEEPHELLLSAQC
jgi:hypothetical protein